MAEIWTPGVYKPSAGTYLYGYGNFWVVWETETQVGVHGEGFAYSDYSVQNGVVCAGAVGGNWNYGTGVTNGGAHIAHWMSERVFDKNNSWQWASAELKVYGETVDGWWGYTNGSWSGNSGSPLAFASTGFNIAPLNAASTPVAPTVSGSGSSWSVSFPASSHATNYVLNRWNPTTGRVQIGAASPNTTYSYSLGANTEYRFSVDARGYNGYWAGGPESPSIYTTPTAPSTLVASAVGTRVDLAWSTNAYNASSVRVERSASSTFASGIVVVYDGTPKNTHSDTPPIDGSGTWYYRVRATAPGGTTGYSNTASATTMVPPSPVSALSRTAPFDSNEFILTWTRNPTTLGPYSSITVQSRSPGGSTWQTLATLSGDDATYTHVAEAPVALEFVVRVSNAAGSSSSEVIGPLYGKCKDPAVIGNTVTKSNVGVTFTFDRSPMPAGATLAIQTQRAFSTDGGATWGSWFDVSHTTTSNSFAVSYVADKMKIVRHRARLTYSGLPDGTDRVSQWVQAESTVGFAPLKPSVSYNKDTLTARVTLPADDVGSSSAKRTVKFYVDGVLNHASTSISGAASSFDLPDVCPCSLFKISAGVTTEFSATEVKSDELAIDFDTTQAIIGGRRHLAFLVYPDRVVPAKVATVR